MLVSKGYYSNYDLISYHQLDKYSFMIDDNKENNFINLCPLNIIIINYFRQLLIIILNIPMRPIMHLHLENFLVNLMIY